MTTSVFRRGLAAILVSFIAITGIAPAASANPPVGGLLVLDAQGQNIDFSKADIVDLLVGETSFYPNVATFDGVSVDALLTLESLTGTATVSPVDESTVDYNNRFIRSYLSDSSSSGPDAALKYSIVFVVAGTQDQVAIQNVALNVYDIDGLQGLEVRDISSYTVGSNTHLSVSDLGGGWTRFVSVDANTGYGSGTAYTVGRVKVSFPVVTTLQFVFSTSAGSGASVEFDFGPGEAFADDQGGTAAAPVASGVGFAFPDQPATQTIEKGSSATFSFVGLDQDTTLSTTDLPVGDNVASSSIDVSDFTVTPASDFVGTLTQKIRAVYTYGGANIYRDYTVTVIVNAPVVPVDPTPAPVEPTPTPEPAPAAPSAPSAPAPSMGVEQITKAPTANGGFIAGDAVTVSGSNLGGLTKATVGGIDVTLTANTDGSFTFAVPQGLAEGTYDLVISGPLGTLTFQGSVKIGRASVTVTQPANGKITKPFSGFAPDSSVLTSKMRSQIADFLKKYKKITKIDLTGFTMGPTVRKSDKALASARAKAVASLIKQLNPEVTTVTQSFGNETILGNKVRRVSITVHYNK